MGIGSRIIKIHGTTAGRIALHCCFWLFFFCLILYVNNISLIKAFDGRSRVLLVLRDVLTAAMVYYMLVYLIWQYLWAKKKYFPGILCFVVLVIVYAIVDYLVEQFVWHSCKPCFEELRISQPGYYSYLHRGMIAILSSRLLTLGILYQLLVYLSFPIIIKIGLEYTQQRVRTLRLQNENIQLEFNFLKSQINPHFLFNTLNNISALILQDKKVQSAETVARLANFMRYTLYESSGNSSPVLKEITLIKDYIALEQIRLNNTVVNFTFDVDKDAYVLPPLLFIPAVENAFKFCAESRSGDSWVFMNLEITAGRLKFNLSNTYDSGPAGAGDEGIAHDAIGHGGIGLQNLRKRLEYYYPLEGHRMEISREKGVFKLGILINLA